MLPSFLFVGTNKKEGGNFKPVLKNVVSISKGYYIGGLIVGTPVYLSLRVGNVHRSYIEILFNFLAYLHSIADAGAYAVQRRGLIICLTVIQNYVRFD